MFGAVLSLLSTMFSSWSRYNWQNCCFYCVFFVTKGKRSCQKNVQWKERTSCYIKENKNVSYQNNFRLTLRKQSSFHPLTENNIWTTSWKNYILHCFFRGMQSGAERTSVFLDCTCSFNSKYCTYNRLTCSYRYVLYSVIFLMSKIFVYVYDLGLHLGNL